MAQCPITAAPRRRWSIEMPPPTLSEATLRIVLLGKSASESSRVGNLILGRSAFDSEAPPDVVERVGGRLKDRHVTLINSPQLLQTNISDDQITQTVRECVSLSDPGPHVFIITLQYRDFTQEDMRRVRRVLNRFSEEAMKRTIIITTDEESYKSKFSSVIRNNPIHQLMKECGGGRLQLEETKTEWPSEIFKRVDEIFKGNQEQYLTCEITHDVKESSGKEDQSSSEEENRSSPYKDDGKARERREEKSDQVSKDFDEKMDLNLVLCGSDATLKISVANILQGKKISSSHLSECSSVCVKKEERIDGRLLSVVELPALSRLSEEEVMRQTLHCVSLCQPGVHAFIFIVSDAPFNNDEKSEIEKIQEIFDSREHFMVLFTTDKKRDDKRLTDSVKHSSKSQSLISLCGGQYRVMGLKKPENSQQIPDLLDYIENMKTEPYSPQMFVKAQENRVRREYEEELKRKDDEIIELKQKIQSEGAEHKDNQSLRIVLIGRTGNGKSATGNTILGRKEFHSQISSDSVTVVCRKGVGQANGRPVAVVDTPGLFDTTLKNDQVVEEIMKCVSLSSPGPNVFVIVLSLGRFTKEETDTLDLIKKIFGPKAAQFSIVLFTRKDELEGESIEDYVKRSNNTELKKLIRDCGNRFLAFNNKEKTTKSTQVIQLFNMIEEVKNTNQGQYFTNDMFEEAEMSIKKKKEEILKEREREIQKEREELQTKYEMEMKSMIKRLEEEKQRADEERMRIENQFREQEEKLRKEFEEKEKIEQMKQETENQKRSEEEKQQRDEYIRKIEELKRETENQRLEYEKQQKEREEEDRKREEKYRQDQEKMKNEQERLIVELQGKQQEETKKRDSEEKRRIKEEEEERQRWEQKMKEAENERKEIQEEIKRQQREWEEEKKRQMREREEEERKRKEKHEEELREKQEELEEMRKRFEREREEEKQKIEEERQKQRREREEKEREYEEKKQETKRHYEQEEQKRKEEWERRKQEEEERQKEENKKWEKRIEDLKQEQDEEIKRREREAKAREEREVKEQDVINQKLQEEIYEMKQKHEDEARKQAEELNNLREGKEQLQQMLEELKAQQEIMDKICDLIQFNKWLIPSLHQKDAEKLHECLKSRKGDEPKKLLEELEKLIEERKNSKPCTIQ